jgi:hypothetical protein
MIANSDLFYKVEVKKETPLDGRSSTSLRPTKRRWGEALTAEKMKKCVRVRPEVVAQLGFWNGLMRIIFGILSS